MVDKNTRNPPPASPGPRLSRIAPLRRLERLIGLASASLLWEKIWRAAMPPLLIAGLFVAVSFAGLWLNVSATWRMLGVALFGCALATSLLPFFGLRRPPRKQALARIDRSSSLAHNPASGLDDQLANESSDPTTRALWALHRRRMMQTVAGLRVGVPSPRMVDFDRYAVRAAILILLVASAFIAGPEKYARLAAAFDWRGNGAAGLGYRIDAWIDPPPYTGKPPVLLTVSAAKDWDQAEQINVPINSTVIVRASGGDVGLEAQGPLDPLKAVNGKPSSAAPAKGDTEQRLILHGDAKLGLRHAGALVGLYDISAIPDKPPQIALTDAPRANLHGSLTLSYKIDDDYGVSSAQADFAEPSLEGAPGKMRSLVPPPRLSLTLPSGLGNLGETEMTADLSDHPWSGIRVKMTLSARDEGGNVGRSDPIEITLPQRPFLKPIARALVEQRRNLVLFPDSRERVQSALDALVIAPEMFETKASVFLGLSVASSMLSDAQNDADLLAVADFLWNMALQIENGDLSDAEKDLRSAEQQLRDALQRNAPDDELRKLTENLRAAMDKFLNELAQKQAREQGQQPQQAERSPNGNRTVSRKDLQSMLDRMQDLARSGDRNDAQQMLEQLQNTLENLQMAQQHNGDPTSREMNRALSDLDKLTREQQRLRDETQRRTQADQQAQDQERGGDQAQQNGQQPDQGAEPQQGQSGQRQPMTQQQLHDLQQALRNRLEEVEKRLKEVGQNQQGLTEAQRAMKDAENALQQGQQNQGQQNQGQQGQGQQGQQGEGEQGQGQQQGGQQGQGQSQGGSQAVEAQGRALEALRKGTEQLAQSMQQGGAGQGNDNGDAQGDQEGQGQAEGAGDTDPLGRPLSNDPAFNPNSRFDPMGLPAAQRAQRVLEELRRRLSDPWRPQEELDYLERLLKPY